MIFWCQSSQPELPVARRGKVQLTFFSTTVFCCSFLLQPLISRLVSELGVIRISLCSHIDKVEVGVLHTSVAQLTFPKLMSQCFERRQHEDSHSTQQNFFAAYDYESCFLTTAVTEWQTDLTSIVRGGSQMLISSCAKYMQKESSSLSMAVSLSSWFAPNSFLYHE